MTGFRPGTSGTGGSGRTRPCWRRPGSRSSASTSFPTGHVWTTETLTGLFFSTSILSRAALGGQAKDLEADLRRELRDFEAAGALPETIGFVYELARRPAQ